MDNNIIKADKAPPNYRILTTQEALHEYADGNRQIFRVNLETGLNDNICGILVGEVKDAPKVVYITEQREARL